MLEKTCWKKTYTAPHVSKKTLVLISNLILSQDFAQELVLSYFLRMVGLQMHNHYRTMAEIN
jgi:hypothetical protein